MRHALLAVGALVSVALLSGCGGGDPPSSPAVDTAPVGGPGPAGAGEATPAAPGPEAAAPDSPSAPASPSASGESLAPVELGGPGPNAGPTDAAPEAPGEGHQPADQTMSHPPGPGEAPAEAADASASPAEAITDPAMTPDAGPTGPSVDAAGMPIGPGAGDGAEGAGMAGQPAARPLTLLEKAALAFHQGRDRDAVLFLYALSVISDADAAKKVLDQMGWIADLKRPAMAIRWGIAVDYVPLRNYGGSVFPIGAAQNLPGRGPGGAAPGGLGAGGMAGGEMPGGAMGDASGPGGAGGAPTNKVLQELTGELGSRVVGQLRERMTRGDFGQTMALLSQAGATARGAAGAGSAVDAEPAGGDPALAQGMPDPAAAGGFDAGAPLGGGRLAEAVPLSPGIVFLGLANPKELRAKAQQAGVDVVCVFSIALTAIPKQQLLKNETKIRVHDLVQSKPLYESKALNNIQVQIERIERKSEQDSVDRELDSLFAFIDANWHLGPLPAGLNADNVLNRLRGLLGQSPENPLPLLAEARMYQTRGLLQDNHFLVVCQKLVGNEAGAQLVNGTAEEKLDLVTKWLPSGP